jgi:hypothetical protein
MIQVAALATRSLGSKARTGTWRSEAAVPGAAALDDDEEEEEEVNRSDS